LQASEVMQTVEAHTSRLGEPASRAASPQPSSGSLWWTSESEPMHMNLALADTPRDLHGYGYYEGMGTGWNSETRVQTRTCGIPVPYNRLAITY